MRCYLVVCLVTLAFSTAHSVETYQAPVAKPFALANEKGCYSVTRGAVLPFNISYYVDEHTLTCVVYDCRPDGSIIVPYACIGMGDECPVVSNLTLHYPGCCADASCATFGPIENILEFVE